MANNVFQVKRTTVSGRTPNTTGSYAANSQYIAAGEFALNMADGILFSSNGSASIPIGANNINVNITGNATIKAIIANGSLGTANQVLTSNGSSVYWANGGGGGASASMIRQAYTGDGSTTVFTVTGGYTANELDVYLNGVKLLNGTDVTVTNGTTFTITPAPMNGATIYAVGFRTTTLVVTDAVLKTGDTMTGSLVVGNTTVGLNSITIGNSSVNTSVNSTVFSGTANNSNYLGGTAAASFQLNSTLSANIASYLPTYTGVVNASSLTVGSIVVGNSTILKANGFTANSTGVFDSADNLRSIPVAAQTAAYVLTSSDNGKTISTNADITVNGAVLTPNQVFTVFNNSSANITITAGTNTTMYQAGTANTGNRTLQQRGVATILMVSANAFVISGAGLA